LEFYAFSSFSLNFQKNPESVNLFSPKINGENDKALIWVWL